MSDTPEFFSKPIDEETAPAKKVVRKKKVLPPSNAQGIKRAIDSIYEDDNGKLPNMKNLQIKKQHPVIRFFGRIIVIGALLAATAWAGFFLLPNNTKFSDTNLEFSITGPETLLLGATSTYTVTIRNGQNTALNQANLNIYYPAGFVFMTSSLPSQNAGHNEWNLGNINANQKTILTITGKNYGVQGDTQSWRALFNYQPSNLNSSLQKTATLNTKFDNSPLQILVGGPNQTTVGTETSYTFKIDNKGSWQPNKLELALQLPNNFAITSSSPTLNKNRWVIDLNGPSSTPLNNLSLTLKGKYTGVGTSSSSIKAVLYIPVTELNQNVGIAQAESTTQLLSNSVALTTAVNGSLQNFSSQPGDTFNTTINIKNTSQQDIKKVVVKFMLTSPAIGKQTLVEWKSINDPADGNIEGEQIDNNTRKGIVTWDSSKIPALALIKSGGEINIDFKLPLKNNSGISLSDLQGNKIIVDTEMTYVDATAAVQNLLGNQLTINVNSDLSFNINHNTSNSGSNEKHDIKWVINNNFHPLKNIKLTADVYGDVTWAAGSTPAGEVNYDPTKKTVTWTIAEMPQSIDVLALPFSFTLNTKNPTQNILMGKVRVTAEDTVTGETINLTGNEISLL